MTLDAPYTGEGLDPSQDTAGMPSAAPMKVKTRHPWETDDAYEGVVAALIPGKLRVIRGRCGLQWINQIRFGDTKSWASLAYCATREGLILRLTELLLKERLKLDYQPQRVTKTDPDTGKPKQARVVSRQALDAADAARVALDRGDVASFGIDPAAWPAIQALPAFFKAKEPAS